MKHSEEKTLATALHLWGPLYLLSRIPRPRMKKPKQTSEPGEPAAETSRDLDRLRMEAQRDAMARKERQKAAETIQRSGDAERVLEIVKRNNAGTKHIAVFVNMVGRAEADGLPVALGIAKRKLGEAEAVKQWKGIRGWLKNRPGLLGAVSIGRRAGGSWVVRWVVVGKAGEDVFSEAAPLPLYLANKRGWINSSVAMEAEAVKLKDHYLTRSDDAEETLGYFATEMFEVYRAALTLPKTTRTCTTPEAKALLETCRKPVEKRAAGAVAFNGDPRFSSQSGAALCRCETKAGTVTGAEWVCSSQSDEFDDTDNTRISFGDTEEEDF